MAVNRFIAVFDNSYNGCGDEVCCETCCNDEDNAQQTDAGDFLSNKGRTS